MKESQILRAAKALIATRKQWTTREFARNARGDGCRRLAEDAVCFCALGAVGRASFELNQDTGTRWPVEQRLHEASQMLYLARNVSAVNDRLGFRAVHAVYDLAITLAEEREAACTT